jgi:hypothetical protein
MAMSGVSLSYAGDGCASKWGEPVSVSDKAIEAMSNTKDRQHDELQAILDVLDEVASPLPHPPGAPRWHISSLCAFQPDFFLRLAKNKS